MMRRGRILCVVCLAIVSGLVSARLVSVRPATWAQASARVAHHTSPARSVVLLGDRSLEPGVARLGAGTVEAIRSRAAVWGMTRWLGVYVARRTRARALVVGVYADRRGRPGMLLASRTLTSPKAGRWASVRLPGMAVARGTAYWIALLAKGGPLYLRQRASRTRADGSCRTVRSTASRLRSLPRTWRMRGSADRCPVSAYISGQAASGVQLPGSGSGSGAPGAGGHPTTTGTPPAATGVAATTSGTASSTTTTSQTTTTTSTPPAPGIHVVGNHLVDGSGITVALHGVDRAGTEYMCSEGYGVTDGPSGDSEFSPMVAWKINSVFIGLNEDCWLGINGINAAFAGQNYIDAIKAEVVSAEKYGLYPVIGFFWGDPGTEVSADGDPNGGGQPALPDNDHAPLFWEEVADTFKGDPNVIFRLQEEPHPGGNGSDLATWQCWSQGDVQYGPGSIRAYGTAPVATGNVSHCNETATNGSTHYETVGMQSLVNLIRGTGATNVIQVPGVQYANMMGCTTTDSPITCGFLDSTDGVRVTDTLANPQLMADVDVYPDMNPCGSTACYDATYAPVIAQMPFEAGETGPSGSGDTSVNQFLDWMDGQGAGYYAWAWDTWAGLINDYSTGVSAAPWGTDYYDRVAHVTPPPPAQPTDGIDIRQSAGKSCLGAGGGNSDTVDVTQPVSAGDVLLLLVAGQGYGTQAGVVSSVSDNVNGAWTALYSSPNRAQSGASPARYLTESVYEVQSSQAAAGGLTITVNGVDGGMSGTVVDLGHVSGLGAHAFNSAVKVASGSNTETGSAVSATANDLVLGFFASWDYGDNASSTGSWNLIAWNGNTNCASAAIDWAQATSTGTLTPSLGYDAGEGYLAGGVDVQP